MLRHKIFETGEFNPWKDDLIHKLLVTSNRLQGLPAWFVGLILAGCAVVVNAIWTLRAAPDDALLTTGVVLATNGINWLSLWLLPRTGHSYGPDRPSALALGILLSALVILAGLVTPVWRLALLIALVLTLAALYATWIEPFRLQVTRQLLETRYWSDGVAPLRLLHLGDLHLERITQRERQLNHMIRELRPDVIVFSGDLINISFRNDPQAEQEVRSIIAQWQAPLGVYFVHGTASVEPPLRVRAFTDGLDNLRVLDDAWETIHTPGGLLHILGLSCTHVLETDRANLKHLAKSRPEDGLKLLLTHSPDIIPEADVAGFDLYLCGHTHGGQIRMPFIGPIFTASALGRRFAMGRYSLSNLTAYITRGIGMEGLGAPRARFFCAPEIILWEISGTHAH